MSIDFTLQSSWDHDFGVNMANGNAARVLERLGIMQDGRVIDIVGALVPVVDDGRMAPSEFLERILLARAGEDVGIPSEDVSNPFGGPRVIQCGVDAGYFTERFNQLQALAEEALRIGDEIVWY